MTNSEQNVETDDSIVNEPTHEHAQSHSESNANEREQEVDKLLEEAQQQAVEYA